MKRLKYFNSNQKILSVCLPTALSIFMFDVPNRIPPSPLRHSLVTVQMLICTKINNAEYIGSHRAHAIALASSEPQGRAHYPQLWLNCLQQRAKSNDSIFTWPVFISPPGTLDPIGILNSICIPQLPEGTTALQRFPSESSQSVLFI